MIKCWVGLGGGGELALPTAVSWKFCYGTGTPVSYTHLTLPTIYSV